MNTALQSWLKHESVDVVLRVIEPYSADLWTHNHSVLSGQVLPRGPQRSGAAEHVKGNILPVLIMTHVCCCLCLFLNALHTSFTAVFTPSPASFWLKVSLFLSAAQLLDLYNHVICLRSQDGTRILCFTSTLLGSRPQSPLLSPGER